MKQYEKIETVFCRDMDGTKRLILNNYRNPTIAYLKDNMWLFTEKVDRTNIRVHWDGHKVEFGGRTDKAQIPGPLLSRLNEMFMTTEAEELFEQTWGDKEVILFGEGYGPKIQNGGEYRSDVSFILFDVLVGDNYQEREWVEKTAQMFNIDVVPIVLTGTIQDGIDYVMKHPRSTMGTAMMEGVVGRPMIELRDRRGERVIIKIKWEDFKHFAT
mgnify:FL=1|jgi:hypothetical protein